MRRHRLSVLIVDDSVTIQRNLRSMFEDFDAVRVVGIADNAARGVAMARKLLPDLVTLDIRMPGGRGLDAIGPLKRLEPSPLVLVLTNYPYSTYRRRAEEEGADFFFDKTLEMHKVLEVLRDRSGRCDSNGPPH